MENNWKIESYKNSNLVENNFQIHGQVLQYFHTSQKNRWQDQYLKKKILAFMIELPAALGH